MAANSAIGSATQPATLPETGLLGERLTAGDFVAAAWNIYRQQFKSYFLLSLRAHLWLLVPVYGWGKFCKGLGIIARLAFNQATNKPEPLNDTLRIATANQWNIFLGGFLVGLLSGGINFAASIANVLFVAVGGALAAVFGSSALTGIVTLLFSFGGQLGLLAVSYWFYARFFLVELPIVTDSGSFDPTEAIGRSWQVTRGSAWRIVTAMFVGLLVATPLLTAAFFLGGILIGVLVGAATAFGEDASWLLGLSIAVSVLLVLVAGLGVGAIQMPLWQTLKGLIYADLCDRREGLGLRLACEKQRERRQQLFAGEMSGEN